MKDEINHMIFDGISKGIVNLLTNLNSFVSTQMCLLTIYVSTFKNLRPFLKFSMVCYLLFSRNFRANSKLKSFLVIDTFDYYKKSSFISITVIIEILQKLKKQSIGTVKV